MPKMTLWFGNNVNSFIISPNFTNCKSGPMRDVLCLLQTTGSWRSSAIATFSKSCKILLQKVRVDAQYLIGQAWNSFLWKKANGCRISGANGGFGSGRSFEMSRRELYNNADELWKRIHRFLFIFWKLTINVLPCPFHTGANERAQKHPLDHVTGLPEDTKITAGELNLLFNCRGSLSSLSLSFMLCRVIRSILRQHQVRIKNQKMSNNTKIAAWKSLCISGILVRIRTSEWTSALKAHFSVNCCVLLYSSTLRCCASCIWQIQGIGHMCLLE